MSRCPILLELNTTWLMQRVPKLRAIFICRRETHFAVPSVPNGLYTFQYEIYNPSG